VQRLFSRQCSQEVAPMFYRVVTAVNLAILLSLNF
jgi:hypothetical protein